MYRIMSSVNTVLPLPERMLREPKVILEQEYLFQLSERLRRRRKKRTRKKSQTFLSLQSLDGLTLAVFVGQLSQGSPSWECDDLSIHILHFWPCKSGRHTHIRALHVSAHIILSTRASFASSDLTALAKSMGQRRGRGKKELLCDVPKGRGVLLEKHHFWLDVFLMSQVHLRFYFHKIKLDVVLS